MDDVDKLSWEYSPVKKLDHEFIRAAFKAGYNKAKETLYTKDQVIEAIWQSFAIQSRGFDISVEEIIQSLKKTKQ
jgi:hypothetical protein